MARVTLVARKNKRSIRARENEKLSTNVVIDNLLKVMIPSWWSTISFHGTDVNNIING
jgi:hypothetical protein